MRCSSRDIVTKMMKLLHSLGYKVGKAQRHPDESSRDVWQFYVYPPTAPDGDGAPVERQKSSAGRIPSPSIGASLPAPGYAATVEFDPTVCDFAIKWAPTRALEIEIERVLRSMRP
jgi:hypothetical protein